MPSFPIIDTHLHLWDPVRLGYSWQKGGALLNRPYRIEDYQRDLGGIEVEAMVFVECHVDDAPGKGQFLSELEFVQDEARRDARIRALVAKAPLERGEAVKPILEEMVARFPTLRGVRRIPEFEPDPRAFMLSGAFLEGMRLLKQFNLHFELNVNYTQMDDALELVRRMPELPIVLDHCGKPGIRGGHIELFRRHIRAFAAHPNVTCKLSDLPVEADWARWTERDIRPFIDATMEAFGPERVMYGGDWPVCLQATSLKRWIDLLDGALSGLGEQKHRMIYRDNAIRVYRLKQ